MTIGIYIRVSTLEQAKEGYSIPAQKERLMAFCQAQGWNDYRFYIDEGVSAKDTNRPKLKLLMDNVASGLIRTILVYRLDRFTRKVKDLHKMLEFLEEHKCAFKSATEPYDTSTAMGKLFITIVAALAEWETDNLSERIKMALEEKVASGERVGNVPYGFDLSEDDTLVRNDQAEVVLNMIQKFKEGWSSTKIADYLNKTNDDKVFWHHKAIYRILRNPALYGATRWNEKVFEDTHEGIITKDEWMRIQTMLEDRGNQHRRDARTKHLFQAKLICHQCGHRLTTNRYIRKKKDGTETIGVIYKCGKCYKEGRTMIQIGEHKYLEAFNVYMEKLIINPHVEESKKDDETQNHLTQLMKIRRKRDKYQHAWASDLISDEEFERHMNETREVMDSLEEKLQKVETSMPVDIEALKSLVETFKTSFHLLKYDEKVSFIARFIRGIEYELIEQPPLRPDKAKNGKPLVIVTNVDFY